MTAMEELKAMVMSARRELDELDQSPIKPDNPGYEQWLRSHVNPERLSTLGWPQVQARLHADFVRWQSRQYELLDFLEQVAQAADAKARDLIGKAGD